MPISLAIVDAAAWLVPRSRREDWRSEWYAELWQVCQAYGVAWTSTAPHGRPEVTSFCLGAFQDALTLRLHATRSLAASRLHAGSPLRTVAILAAAVLTSLLLCLASPSARMAAGDALWRRSHPPTDNLVLISSEGQYGAEFPTVRFADYELWKTQGRRPFHRLAFYRPAAAQVQVDSRHSETLRVAYASLSLMDILDSALGSRAVSAVPSQGPLALLSRQAWRRDFHSDSHIAGRSLLVGGRPVILAGIAAGESWPVPGVMDLVVFEPYAELARVSSGATGFVLAPAVRPALLFESKDRPYLVLRRASGKAARFECLTLAQRREDPQDLFLFSLLLASLALPALTPLPLGDYPEAPNAATTTIKLRRWSFLLLKLACIFPTAFLAPLFLSCCVAIPGAATAAYLQIVLSFATLLFGFRWALQDQRKRCPACLRLLSHPAMVGHASHSFLAWCGTELLCVGGHGFLHIPEHPTSWFSTQRWVAVDASWSGLFSAIRPATGP